MDEFVMTIKKHKETIVIALAILMFILFGFCPAIDIIGKAKIGGLKLLFEGSGLGFARFLSIFVLLAPMFVALGRSVDLKLTGKLAENFSALCFVAGIVLCLLFALALPSGANLAWGSWLYMLTGVLGVIVCRIEMFTKN